MGSASRQACISVDKNVGEDRLGGCVVPLPLHELDSFLLQNFGTLLCVLELLQATENPVTIYGLVFASQPRTNERVAVAVFSSRKADPAGVGAAGPSCTPANVFAVIFVVLVFVQLSINANESGLVPLGQPTFAGFNGGQYF